MLRNPTDGPQRPGGGPVLLCIGQRRSDRGHPDVSRAGQRRGEHVEADLVDETGVGVAGGELRRAQRVHQHVPVGHRSVQRRIGQARARTAAARCRVGAQLITLAIIGS